MKSNYRTNASSCIRICNAIMLVCIMALTTVAAQAQTSSNSSGGAATGSGGTVNYSVGQVVYTTSTGTTGTVTQGVQQAFEIFVTTGIEQKGISLNISAYPNPTTDYITLEVDAEHSQSMNLQLYDINGKLLQKQENLAVETQIEMSDYEQGIYFLNIVANNQKIKSFKIIKN